MREELADAADDADEAEEERVEPAAAAFEAVFRADVD